LSTQLSASSESPRSERKKGAVEPARGEALVDLDGAFGVL